MPLTETPETQAMLDEMDKLDEECDLSIVGILEHNVRLGNLKPAIFEASNDAKEYWACRLNNDYKTKRKRIHDLNLSWNIAHGLY